jgi:hypothetical protein
VQREQEKAGKPFRAFEVLNLGRYERQAYLNVNFSFSRHSGLDPESSSEDVDFRSSIGVGDRLRGNDEEGRGNDGRRRENEGKGDDSGATVGMTRPPTRPADRIRGKMDRQLHLRK